MFFFFCFAFKCRRALPEIQPDFIAVHGPAFRFVPNRGFPPRVRIVSWWAPLKPLRLWYSVVAIYVERAHSGEARPASLLSLSFLSSREPKNKAPLFFSSFLVFCFLSLSIVSIFRFDAPPPIESIRVSSFQGFFFPRSALKR